MYGSYPLKEVLPCSSSQSDGFTKKHQVGFVNALGYQPVYVLVHWACYPRGVFALSINLECSLYKYFVKIRSMLLCSPVMYHTYIRRIRKRAIPCSSSQSDGFTKKQKVDVLSTLFRYQAV